MSEAFDPYFKWLGIPPDQQPPHHYRLLGLPEFVDDADVIENAADQRMAHVRTLQSGKHSQLSQKILNELSSARVCLLNPETKSAYDANLKEELESQQVFDVEVVSEPEPPVGFPPISQTVAPALVGSNEIGPNKNEDSPFQSNVKTAEFKTPNKWLLPLVLGGSSVIGLALIVALVFFQRPISSPPIEVSPNKTAVSSSSEPPSNDLPVKPVTSNIPPQKPPATPTNDLPDDPPASKPPINMVTGPYRLTLLPDGSIVVPDTEQFVSFDQDFTVEAWCKWDPVDKMKAVLSAVGNSDLKDHTAGWMVRLFEAKDSELTQVTLSFYADATNGRGGMANVAAELKDLDLAKWHHVAVTKSVGYFSFYFNGQRVIHFPIKHNHARTTEGRLTLGTYPPGCRLASYDSTGGEVQAVRVSRGARYPGSQFVPPGEFENDANTLALLDFTRPVNHRVNLVESSTVATLDGVSWVHSDGSAVAFSTPDALETTPINTNRKFVRPTDEEIESARTNIRPLFADAYRDATTDDKRKQFAQSLLSNARKDKELAINRFVLLDEALKMAFAASDIDLAWQINDQLLATFDVSEWDAIVHILKTGSTVVRTPEQRSNLIKSALAVVEPLVENNRIDLMIEAMTIANSLAAKPGVTSELRVTVRKKTKIYGPIKIQRDAALDAGITLKTDPENPQANKILGLFQSLIMRDWKQGLALLAKADNDQLKSVATKDLAGADDAVQQIGIGDAWWKLSEDFEFRAKESLQLRARHWYELALNDAPEFTKQKLTERISATDDLVTILQPSNRPAVIEETRGLVGALEISENKKIYVQYVEAGILRTDSWRDLANDHDGGTNSNHSMELKGYVDLNKASSVLFRVRGGRQFLTALPWEIKLRGQLVTTAGGKEFVDVTKQLELPAGRSTISIRGKGALTNLLVEIRDSKNQLLPFYHNRSDRVNSQRNAIAQIVTGYRSDPTKIEEVVGWLLDIGGRPSIQYFKPEGLTTIQIKEMEDLPNDYFDVHSVVFYDDAGDGITDETVKKLVDLRQLALLRLARATITNAGLETISKIKSLRGIDLASLRNVSPMGFSHLATLPQLDRLTINQIPATTFGILPFKHAPLGKTKKH